MHVLAAQIAAVGATFRNEAGEHRHSRVLEQLRFRLTAIQRSGDAEGALADVRTDHFVALLDGIAAGRTELIQMFKAGKIDAEVLRALEKEFDADEIHARHLMTPLDRQIFGRD